MGLIVAGGIVRYGGRLLAKGFVDEMDERLGLGAMRADIQTIKAEVTVNGGGSLKDRVLEVQRRVEQEPR